PAAGPAPRQRLARADARRRARPTAPRVDRRRARAAARDEVAHRSARRQPARVRRSRVPAPVDRPESRAISGGCGRAAPAVAHALDALFARALALSGQHDRAMAIVDDALGRIQDGPERVDLAITAALAQFYKGDLDAARSRYLAARDLAREALDRAREANATNG